MKPRALRTAVVVAALSVAPRLSTRALAEPTGLDANGHLADAGLAGKDGFAFARLENGVQVRVNGVTKNVIFYGPSTVRVNANPGENHWKHPSLVVVQKPAATSFDVDDGGSELNIKSPKLRISIDKASGAVSFYDASGKLFTKEKSDAPQTIKPVTLSDAPTYEVSNTFTLKPDEGLFGFGFGGPQNLNRRGKNLELIQTNLGIVIPMMVSSERYGILWDTYSIMRFRDNADGATLSAESAPGGVDYYFFRGTTMDDVIAEYRQLTGPAPMVPKQALGLFMSKERYKTQDEVVSIAKRFRDEQFPLDYMVQDWQYWGSDKDGTWSGMTWNAERYPHPEEMTKSLHDMGMKLMISIWPSVGNDTELAKELDASGLRFEPLHWISKKARIYDAFSAEGRQIYFKYIKSGLFDKGIDALWMDGTEVEVGTACWNAREVARDIKSLGTNAMGDFSRYLNPYTLMTTQGTYDGQRATSDKRVLTLTRSAWAGAQRTGAASWSGDCYAGWDTLQSEINGGVNVTIAGNPYFTQDTGGFFVNARFRGGTSNAAYRELFTRWYQFSAFNPLFRVHGTDIDREPWRFKALDPEMYQALLDVTNLRYQLMPYLYGLAWRVTNDGYTMMRAIPMDFPDDKATFAIDDAFLFGPSLLVHPVTRAMYHNEAPPARTISPDLLTTADGQPGLAVQYFSGTDFNTPAGKSIDTRIDYTWPGPPLANPPAGLTGFDNFSARWEGFLTPPEDGEYELGIEYDDGGRLFIDNKLIAEDWGLGPKRYRGGKVTLAKGQKVAIKAEYKQGGSDRAFRVTMRRPAEVRQIAEKPPVDENVKTYLPKGADWYDYWTNEKTAGGETATRKFPMNVFPLYVRAGSIVPMGPTMQYATEKPDAPYDVRVYPGANATFTLYEDDNETYAYEKGQRATVKLDWDDAAKTLTIGDRDGTFPGLVKSRVLNVKLIAPGKTVDAASQQTVTYDGTKQVVTFK